jgi:hypothetical protein
MCNPTASPWFDAQDTKLSDFRICAATNGTVRVEFTNLGDRVVLRYLVAKTPSGWRISDVLYETGSSLVKVLGGEGSCAQSARELGGAPVDVRLDEEPGPIGRSPRSFAMDYDVRKHEVTREWRFQ